MRPAVWWCLFLSVIAQSNCTADTVFAWEPGHDTYNWYSQKVHFDMATSVATCSNVTKPNIGFQPKIQVQNGQPIVTSGYDSATRTWVIWMDGGTSPGTGIYTVKPFAGKVKLLSKLHGPPMPHCMATGSDGRLYALKSTTTTTSLVVLDPTTGKTAKVVTKIKRAEGPDYFRQCFWDKTTNSLVWLSLFPTWTQYSLATNGSLSVIKAPKQNFPRINAIGFDSTLQRWNMVVGPFTNYSFGHFEAGKSFVHVLDIAYKAPFPPFPYSAWSDASGLLYFFLNGEYPEEMMVVDTRAPKATVLKAPTCHGWGYLVTQDS